MTTLEDSQEISNSTVSSPPGVIQQDTEIVNPVSLDVSMGALTLSHDHETNDQKIETIESFVSKWRFYESKIIETSSSGVVGTWWSSLRDYRHIATIGNPHLSDAGMFSDYAHAGIRFDLQLKFTIYSSSQQQGALIFVYWPGMCTRTHSPFTNTNLLGLDGPIYGEKKPDLNYETIETYLQLPYKVVAFGGETEVVMTIPFSSKYDFIPTRNYHVDAAWGCIQMAIFDPLVVKSGTYDKVNIRVERRIVNLKLVGPNYNKDIVDMGDYGAP